MISYTSFVILDSILHQTLYISQDTDLGKIYLQIKLSLQEKSVQNRSKQIQHVGRFRCERISENWCFYWRKRCYIDYGYLGRSDGLKYKHLNNVFDSCKSRILMAHILAHSDGTHSLQRIHCWASDVILQFIRSAGASQKIRTWRKSIFFNCNLFQKVKLSYVLDLLHVK